MGQPILELAWLIGLGALVAGVLMVGFAIRKKMLADPKASIDSNEQT